MRSKSRAEPHSPTKSSRKPFGLAWIKPKQKKKRSTAPLFLQLVIVRNELKEQQNKNQKTQLPLEFVVETEIREGHGTFSSTTRLLLLFASRRVFFDGGAPTPPHKSRGLLLLQAPGQLKKWNRTRRLTIPNTFERIFHRQISPSRGKFHSVRVGMDTGKGFYIFSRPEHHYLPQKIVRISPEFGFAKILVGSADDEVSTETRIRHSCSREEDDRLCCMGAWLVKFDVCKRQK